jgi:hypothetical protein
MVPSPPTRASASSPASERRLGFPSMMSAPPMVVRRPSPARVASFALSAIRRVVEEISRRCDKPRRSTSSALSIRSSLPTRSSRSSPSRPFRALVVIISVPVTSLRQESARKSVGPVPEGPLMTKLPSTLPMPRSASTCACVRTSVRSATRTPAHSGSVASPPAPAVGGSAPPPTPASLPRHHPPTRRH